MIRIAVFLIVLLPKLCTAQEIELSVAAFHHINDADLAVFPDKSNELFPGTERFTPSLEEVLLAEDALVKQLPALNTERHNQYATPVIDKNLKKYKRQYFGYIDAKGNKILFINCFWRKDKEGSELWLKEMIRVHDGGSYYWNVKFNLETGKLFDLDVNGEA